MTLRFGLFGTGDWARDLHATALAAEPAAELVGVWGRNPAKAAALADRFGIAAYDDVDALLGDVDAISVALPPDVQAGIAIRAAESGRHLLLDKPLALDLATADRVVAATDAAGVNSVVFFTLRFAQASAEWVQTVTAEGPWSGLRATWFASHFHPDGHLPDSPWRRERGALWDVGPHALSLAMALLGPVQAVEAVAGAGDTVHLLLRHAEAASTVSLSLTMAPAAAIVECAVYGDNGWRVMPPSPEDKVEAMRSAIRQLVDGVEHDSRDHPCDVHFARDVVAVLESAQTALAADPGRRG
ncbi:MAG: Gfo/Idh/MocA family oxidoreductase [Mycobacteriales bacterium]